MSSGTTFIQKDDRFTQMMAELAGMAFGKTDDVFLTMRFSNLHGEEEFSNTVGFGGWMALLDTGIAQIRHQVEVLQKLRDLAIKKLRATLQKKEGFTPDMLKDFEEKVKKGQEPIIGSTLTEEDLKASNDVDIGKFPRVPNYDPYQVHDLISKFQNYKLNKPPDDPENITVIRNDLWPYNRNLMAGLRFRYIHLALLNGRYAELSRTFNKFVEMTQGLENRPKEIERKEGGIRIPNPFGGKKKE